LLAERRELRQYLDAVFKATRFVDVEARQRAEEQIAELVLRPLRVNPREKPSTGAIVAACMSIFTAPPSWGDDPLEIWAGGIPAPSYQTTNWPQALKKRAALLSLVTIEALVARELTASYEGPGRE
jgi:hypothetical protein